MTEQATSDKERELRDCYRKLLLAQYIKHLLLVGMSGGYNFSSLIFLIAARPASVLKRSRTIPFRPVVTRRSKLGSSPNSSTPYGFYIASFAPTGQPDSAGRSRQSSSASVWGSSLCTADLRVSGKRLNVL